MKTGVFALVAGALAALVSGCVTTVQPVSVQDKGQWDEAKAMHLINDSFNVKGHLGLAGGSLNGPKAVLSQIDHLADKNGLTALLQTDYKSWSSGNTYGHTISFKPYHIPYSSIEKVETRKRSHYIWQWMLCGLVNPIVFSEGWIDVTTKDGKKTSYFDGPEKWNLIPLWIVRPFYNYDGKNKKLAHLGEAFEYLRQNTPVPDPKSTVNVVLKTAPRKPAVKEAAVSSGLFGQTMEMKFEATDKAKRKVSLAVGFSAASQSDSVGKVLPALFAFMFSPAKSNLVASVENTNLSDAAKAGDAFEAFGHAFADVIKKNQRAISGGQITVTPCRTTGLEAGVITLVYDAESTGCQYFVRPGFNSSQPKMQVADAKEAFGKLLWSSR